MPCHAMVCHAHSQPPRLWIVYIPLIIYAMLRTGSPQQSYQQQEIPTQPATNLRAGWLFCKSISQLIFMLAARGHITNSGFKGNVEFVLCSPVAWCCLCMDRTVRVWSIFPTSSHHGSLAPGQGLTHGVIQLPGQLLDLLAGGVSPYYHEVVFSPYGFIYLAGERPFFLALNDSV